MGWREKQRLGQQSAPVLPYCGDVSLKRLTNGAVSEGQHPAIIDPEIWDTVQDLLQGSACIARGSRKKATTSLLAGKLFDETGDRLTPSHSRKNGKRLRYYISRRLVKDRSRKHPDAWRVPAEQVERLLTDLVTEHLGRTDAASSMIQNASAAEIVSAAEKLKDLMKTQACLALVERAELRPGLVTVKLSAAVLEKHLGCQSEQINWPILMIEAPFQMRRRGVELKLHLGAPPPEIDQTLVQNIIKGRRWLSMVIAGKTFSEIAEADGASKRRVSDKRRRNRSSMICKHGCTPNFPASRANRRWQAQSAMPECPSL